MFGPLGDVRKSSQVTNITSFFGAGLDGNVFWILMLFSFLGSFITVAMGIGGGALLLAVMASLMPPAALIPVHGVIQFGSNISRFALLASHTYWPPILAFTLGTIVGVTLGGAIVIDLPPAVIQISIGCFIAWTVLFNPPKWLHKSPGSVGAIANFLTMFFGATGVFVAGFSKSLNLPRQAHVATHAAMMSLQHALKVVAFGILGFSFSTWLPFIAAMIGFGILGTIAGRMVLVRLSDRVFKRTLDIILLLISLRLVLNGLSTVSGAI